MRDMKGIITLVAVLVFLISLHMVHGGSCATGVVKFTILQPSNSEIHYSGSYNFSSGEKGTGEKGAIEVIISVIRDFILGFFR